MTTTAKKTLVLVGLGVVVAAVVLWQALHMTQPRAFTVRSARIAALDVATRSGEIEFIHPKSGRRTTVTARNIPADCEITIDGRTADVSELRVGDAVAVRGLFYPYDQSARPQAVHVTRASPATQPTSLRSPLKEDTGTASGPCSATAQARRHGASPLSQRTLGEAAGGAA